MRQYTVKYGRRSILKKEIIEAATRKEAIALAYIREKEINVVMEAGVKLKLICVNPAPPKVVKNIVEYKGVKVNLPPKVLINTFKEIVDNCGKDYCITVQSFLDFLNKTIK